MSASGRAAGGRVYLAAGVCGDSQAVGHQAGRFVLLHQPDGSHGDGHLEQNRRLPVIPSFSSAVTHPYLDVLAEEVGMETQPVPRNVEAALQKDVSEERAGVHWQQKRHIRDL